MLPLGHDWRTVRSRARIRDGAGTAPGRRPRGVPTSRPGPGLPSLAAGWSPAHNSETRARRPVRHVNRLPWPPLWPAEVPEIRPRMRGQNRKLAAWGGPALTTAAAAVWVGPERGGSLLGRAALAQCGPLRGARLAGGDRGAAWPCAPWWAALPSGARSRRGPHRDPTT
ncbi:hypothetical protein SMALA_8631 (plasmid) [Streptomyces malaysiensis subsp. malaysiensis]|nr:hypothetical protein SMALA_8631 [Streptomyces malaysiensis]